MSLRSLCAVAVMSLGVAAAAMSADEAARWAEDLDVYSTQLRERHIDLYHRLDEATFANGVDALKADLPTLNPLQAEMALWGLTHAIGGGVSDGHTAIRLDPRRYRWLPLRFELFEDAVRIVGTTAEHAALRGTRLIAVGETSIGDVRNALADVAQYAENEQSSRAFQVVALRVADVLVGLGLATNVDSLTLTFRHDDGRTQVLALASAPFAETHAIEDGYPRTQPVVTAPEDASSPTLWFAPLETATPSVYVKFDQYPTYQEMETFGATLLADIQARSVRNVVIDLRDNRGGDGFVGERLAAAILDENVVDWRHGVYVLTGKTTYSAATVNAVQYRQILNAKLVGEPTGSNPTGYQDADAFALPNSGLQVSYSKRLFRLQERATPGVQPDKVVIATWQHRKAGVDAALDWIVGDIAARTPLPETPLASTETVALPRAVARPRR